MKRAHLAQSNSIKRLNALAAFSGLRHVILPIQLATAFAIAASCTDSHIL